jgi:hypothetical protein
MNPLDLRYLEACLASFIETSTNRLSRNGSMSHVYRITAAEVKERTKRQRLHEAVISDYLNFFARHQVQAEFVSDYSDFTVTVDLRNCILSPQQSKFVSAAMDHFRSLGD